MFINIFVERWNDIYILGIEHLELTLIALLVSLIVAVPTGIILTRYPDWSEAVINLTSVFQTIPSIALLGFLVPFMGIGKTPALVALTLYALLPILRNTYMGIKGVNKSLIEAATGMGMTNMQILYKVELPLALPIIMGGIRTATVIIIGVTTLAALVGAGGLGELIFRGVSTSNQNLILAGAIPAAVLAVLADYLLKKLEDMLQNQTVDKTSMTKQSIFARNKKLILVALTVVILSGVSYNMLFNTTKGKIVVAGKDYTEQEILVYILKHTIEGNTDLKVDAKPYLGGTNIVEQAAASGEIDVYVEYTGTMLNLLGMPLENNAEKSYASLAPLYKSKKQRILLQPLGFNNTYTMAMKREKAEKANINTISDLKKHSKDLNLACTYEFSERLDGYVGLVEKYNIGFKSVGTMDTGLTYTAVGSGKMDVCDAFSTDSRIISEDLKILEDDLKFFPNYNAVPVVREETLNKHPEIAEALNKLAGKISEAEMTKLNSLVALEKLNSSVVAMDWLKSKGIVK